MSISFLVPTHREDRPLPRCLNSIAYQLAPDDEVLVMGDTHEREMPRVESLVASYGPQFRYVPFDAGGHDWGHSQLNHALTLAQGDYIHANDDDDVWTPIAGLAMRRAIAEEPEQPHLFRFQSYFGTLYWDQRGRVELNHIGGHCLLFPNVAGKVGRYGSGYTGDFDMIRSTLDLHGGDRAAVWHEDLVCIARPG